MASVNSPATNQLAMAIDAADDHLNQLETALKGTGARWGSSLELCAVQGSARRRTRPGPADCRVTGGPVFTDFIAAIARVYTGGQAITNDMLALASRNIDRD